MKKIILANDILIEGNKLLNRVASKVYLPIRQTDIELLNSLRNYLVNSQNPEFVEKYKVRPGVGIAAPQIGVNKRIFVMKFQDIDGTVYDFGIINPIIINKSVDIIYLNGGEGCLSVNKDTFGQLTPRYKWITFSFVMFDFPTQKTFNTELTLSDYPGIVFQHEYDHLEGILYTSKLFATLPSAKPLIEDDEENKEI